MLKDTDIPDLRNKLATITQDSQHHFNNLQTFIEKVQDLLQSYNSLKSDYEEEKEAREKYKKRSRAQVRRDRPGTVTEDSF